jgi:hypothetical protein
MNNNRTIFPPDSTHPIVGHFFSGVALEKSEEAGALYRSRRDLQLVQNFSSNSVEKGRNKIKFLWVLCNISK